MDQIGFLERISKAFPPLLAEIAAPPEGLFYKGSFPPEGRCATIAIVGTRRATPEGRRIARDFARDLARSGCAIVSGLAFGIDRAAHEGCLAANAPTIAVLAGGLHAVYPREHDRLAEEILASGGALVSEYPPGELPYPARFLERNRLIAGLAHATVIIEAPLGSGSLRTAREALDANREVFVVPGAIRDQNYAGSHELIKKGAALVTSAEDILEALGVERRHISRPETRALSPEERAIMNALSKSRAPSDIDKIATITRLEPRNVNRTISFLIAKDLIREEGGKYTI